MTRNYERFGRRTVLKSIGAAGVIGSAGVVAADEEREHLRDLRRANSKYQNLEKAREDGYELDDHCVENPDGSGAMGYHAGKEWPIDEKVSPDEPEILVYEKKGDSYNLVAAEFVSTADERPELFGQGFHDSPENFPWDWDLHVWAWKDNPRGRYAPFNPRVSCPEGDEE